MYGRKYVVCCIKVRTASISDLRDVYDIEISSFGADAYPFELLLYYFILSREYFFVAECINRVVGYVVGVIEHDEKSKYGHVISIAVHPLYRGLGIGRKLMMVLEEKMFLNNVEYIYLEVRETNYVAINLYKSLGYRVARKLANYYGAEDGLLMIKRRTKNTYHSLYSISNTGSIIE